VQTAALLSSSRRQLALKEVQNKELEKMFDFHPTSLWDFQSYSASNGMTPVGICLQHQCL